MASLSSIDGSNMRVFGCRSTAFCLLSVLCAAVASCAFSLFKSGTTTNVAAAPSSITDALRIANGHGNGKRTLQIDHDSASIAAAVGEEAGRILGLKEPEEVQRDEGVTLFAVTSYGLMTPLKRELFEYYIEELDGVAEFWVIYDTSCTAKPGIGYALRKYLRSYTCDDVAEAVNELIEMEKAAMAGAMTGGQRRRQRGQGREEDKEEEKDDEEVVNTKGKDTFPSNFRLFLYNEEDVAALYPSFPRLSDGHTFMMPLLYINKYFALTLWMDSHFKRGDEVVVDSDMSSYAYYDSYSYPPGEADRHGDGRTKQPTRDPFSPPRRISHVWVNEDDHLYAGHVRDFVTSVDNESTFAQTDLMPTSTPSLKGWPHAMKQTWALPVGNPMAGGGGATDRGYGSVRRTQRTKRRVEEGGGGRDDGGGGGGDGGQGGSRAGGRDGDAEDGSKQRTVVEFLMRFSPRLLSYLGEMLRLNIVSYGESFAGTFCRNADWCREGDYPQRFFFGKNDVRAKGNHSREAVGEQKDCMYDWYCRVSWNVWKEALLEDISGNSKLLEPPPLTLELEGLHNKWYHSAKFLKDKHLHGLYDALPAPT